MRKTAIIQPLNVVARAPVEWIDLGEKYQVKIGGLNYGAAFPMVISGRLSNRAGFDA
mgnify:CR=1 FL=1